MASNLKVVANKVDGLMRSVKVASQYKRNVVNLRIQLMRLEETRDKLQHCINDAKKSGQEITRHLKKRMDDMNQTLEDGNEVLANLKSKRFRLSHRAMSLAERASFLISNALKDLDEHFFQSSFGEIKKTMEDDNFQIIGIWGLHGVDITTLAEKVASDAEEEKLFDRVLMATVPPNTDEKQIQQLLTDEIGLKFTGNETMEKRAIQLYERIRKEDRILVILDDIQDKVNLENLGLPIGDDHKGCKILLTSKTYDVLTREMGAQKLVQVDNIYTQEVWNFFGKMAADIAQDSDMQSLANDIAKRLRLSPVLIASFVAALRNKHVSGWKQALYELHTEITDASLNVTAPLKWRMLDARDENDMVIIRSDWWAEDQGRYRIFYSTMMFCYNHLKSEETKLLFLLIGSIGSSYVSKHHLFLVGMGFGLFNQADTLEGGRNRLQELIDELKDACLLIEDQEHCVRMDEIICPGVTAILSGPKFNIRSQEIDSNIKEWPYESCPLIFKPFSHLSYLLEVENTPQLEVIIIGLDNDVNFLKIPESYFERMKKLKVLHLRGNFIFPSQLPSLDFLKSLIVLSLFECHLIDATILAKLTNMEVLSLNGSNIQTLAKEFGQLHCLRLLDLENSSIREIVPGVLSKLESLEELYLGSTNICWGVKGTDNESTNATLNELGALNHLKILHLTVRDVQAWPTDLFFKCHLKFRILIGGLWLWDDKDTCQTLKLQHGNIHSDQGIKKLLKVVEVLVLDETPGLKNILYDLNAEGFPKLKYLNIQNNNEIVFIVDLMDKVQSPPTFPNLISLVLHNLNNLECICNSPLAVDYFSKLNILKVTCCNKIKNLLQFYMIKMIPQLVEIEVSNCKIMEEIILLEEENVNQLDRQITFSCLQSLVVCNLPALICFCSKEMKPSTLQWSYEKQMETQTLNKINKEHSSIAFFNEKVAFPKLEILHLSSLNFDNIWGDQLFGVTSSTQNLTKLTIEKLHGLKYLFSISMLRCLKKLKHLEMKNCPMMENIFVMEETKNNTRYGSNKEIFFPNLMTMIVHSMENLRSMWHPQLATPYSFCKLKKIKINNCSRLNSIFPSYIISNLKNLHSLSVDNCNLSIYFRSSKVRSTRECGYF